MRLVSRVIIIVAALIGISGCGQSVNASSDSLGSHWQNCTVTKEVEKLLWISLFDHYLSKKFVQAYMSCTGKPVELTAQEMADTWAFPVWTFDQETRKVIEQQMERRARTGQQSIFGDIDGKILARSLGGV